VDDRKEAMTTGAQVPDDKQLMELTIRNDGAVIADGMAIGRFTPYEFGPQETGDEKGRLTINLGWAKLAGLGITIQGDPEVDKKRGGVVLER
jgi:hypothetical protein